MVKYQYQLDVGDHLETKQMLEKQERRCSQAGDFEKAGEKLPEEFFVQFWQFQMWLRLFGLCGLILHIWRFFLALHLFFALPFLLAYQY